MHFSKSIYLLNHSSNKCKTFKTVNQRTRAGTVKSVDQKIIVDAAPEPTPALSVNVKQATAVGCAALIMHCRASRGGKPKAHEYIPAMIGLIISRTTKAVKNLSQWHDINECCDKNAPTQKSEYARHMSPSCHPL